MKKIQEKFVAPKRRNPAASSLADRKFAQRIIASKKVYNRKKQRGLHVQDSH